MSKTETRTRLKVPSRALIQRINRKLKQDGEQLRTARSERVEGDVGRYYIIDLSRNFIAHKNVDLEKLGRELAVIQPWEELEGD